LHRITSDEIFHFYGGDPVEMIQFDESGHVTRFVLGSDLANGEVPQVIVPAGVWQALKLVDGGAWGLMGTTVAPGFDFADFELGDCNTLLKTFPKLDSEIRRFTRQSSCEKALE
jgi:predicted cupin superfamily sugar epimerase